MNDKAPVPVVKLGKDDLRELVEYLKISHDFYTRDCFPVLHANIHKMLECCDGKVGQAMNKFFDDYEQGVLEHFKYEEQVLFPYAEKLLDGAAGPPLPKEGEKKYHLDIVSCLNDMKALILNHIPSTEGSQARVIVLSYLFRMGDDMHKHVLVEDRLFIPLLRKMEKENGK